MHTVAAEVLEYVPTLQFAHTETLVAPVVMEYVPATHAVHVEAVVAFTVAEYVPAPQFVHDTLPDEFLYFPEVQVVH